MIAQTVSPVSVRRDEINGRYIVRFSGDIEVWTDNTARTPRADVAQWNVSIFDSASFPRQYEETIVLTGITRADGEAWACEEIERRYTAWQASPSGQAFAAALDKMSDPQPEPPAPAADDTDNDPEPYEPGVFGGAHPGDDETDNEDAGITWSIGGWVSATVDADAKTVTVDGITGTLDSMKKFGCYGEYDLTATVAGVKITASMVPTNINDNLIQPVTFWPAPEPKTAQPAYATIPVIGGGSHEADTTPRNQATSQKRDNQRAQRAALNEAYKAHAAGKASEVSDILVAFGFEVVSTKDVDGTPVTIWQDTTPTEIDGIASEHIAHATIKQTPYSLRIYNGQPNKLPRHGDAELINRVEHGWCACGEMRGYADGLAHAILRLIEVPDPYMQALDDLEAREADQSAPDTQAEYGMLYQRISDAADTIGLDADEAEAAYDEYLAAVLPDSSDLVRAAIRSDYTIAAPGHNGRPVIIAEVEHHSIPNPVLIGGQPSMSGPWQVPVMSGGSQESEDAPDYCGLEIGDRVEMTMSPYVGHQGFVNDLADGQAWVSFDNAKSGHRFVVEPWQLQRLNEPTPPAISGGSQDADTPTAEHIAALKQPTSDGNHLAPDDPEYGYCLTGCERQATQWIKQGVNFLAYCDECAPCQHDADEPPARFCSQCGHDRSPDAPQPTDTGQSYDVLPLTKRYTRRTLETKCAEASAILGKHVEIVQEPASKRYAVTYDLTESMRDNPGNWLRERDCNTIRYWIEHLNAEIRRHRARMSATDTGTSHDVTTPSDPDTGDRVTIEHTPEGGTIVTGDTRPQSATLKMCGFKWSRQLGAWYIPNSRDRRADMYKINKTAQAIRANHASVTLDIDDRAVDPATVEANRAERLADRHAALTRKAEKLEAKANAHIETADKISERFAMGQPILVDHYSAPKALNDQKRMHAHMSKGVEAFRDAETIADQAKHGAYRQAKRMTAPATMRRIEKLETERRDLERRAARGQVGTIGGPTIAERLDDNARDLAYWRDHLATLEAQGVKVWRPEDFTKGDLVLDQFGLVTVNRINKKSLSVTTHYTFDHGREWSKTVTFDDIKGKATAEQAERFRTA